MNGTVFLVGAGCGTVDLLTRRADELIQAADAIVCDALVDASIVDRFPSKADVTFVGKRAHKPSVKQEEINSLLVEKARRHQVVVRLKGGDPFVFGRGGEEAQTLLAAKIPFEIVPGVSSALAVPALAGIPVTHRNLARSFHVVTAHGSDGPCDLRAFGQLDGTLVILMGFSRLREIAQELIAGGRNKTTPVAVISQGATPRQLVATGTLETIADRVDLSPLVAPAVIVVGEVAALDLIAPIVRPLEGVRVALVGTDSFRAKLSRKLSAVGAEVVSDIRLKIEKVSWALPDFSLYSWLVLTSPNGVAALFEKLRETKIDVRLLPKKIAVLGPGTAEALAAHHLYPALMPETYTAQALGEALAHAVQSDERILILRSAEGSRELTQPLDAAHFQFDDQATYTTRPQILRADYADENADDYLVFGSARGARAFFETRQLVAPGTRVVAIGPVTAQALKDLGVSSVCGTPSATADGIIAALIQDYQESQIK